MNKILKRGVSAVMAAAITITTVFVFDVPKLTASAAAHQNHKVCGDLSCTDSSHASVTWTELSSFTGGTLSEGSYYLTSNINLSSNMTISGEVNLCLNGNTINANNNSRVISIEEGGTLNLCDCSSGQAGKLTGGNCTSIPSGGGVCNSGTFNMYGGTISGNTAKYYGGGVYNKNGTFNMYGGAISGNTVQYSGGGVYNSGGTFNMYSGTISDNTSNGSSAGGVNNFGTFNMYGGTISGNAADDSGGGVHNSRTFNMYGGTISGNTTGKSGGGVYAYSGTLTLNGNVSITGNTKDATADNVYLSGGTTLTIGESFSTLSRIGVSAEQSVSGCAKGFNITGTVSSDISSCFTPDVDGLIVDYKDNKLRLIEPHSYNSTYSCDDDQHWYECSVCGDKKDPAAHSGGTATCQTKATCSVCGQKYGSVGAHNYGTTWTTDADQHWYACQTSGCTDKSDTADHTFVQKKDGTKHWQECSVCGYKQDETAHSWSNWTLKTEPTLNSKGTAERACSCGEKQTKTDVPALTDTIWTKSNRTDPTLDGTGSEDYTSTEYGKVTITIPALSNETVWTKTSHKEATEEAEGEDVYESTDHGTVTVILPQLDHTHVWGDWEITKAPTLNDEGTAKRVCTKDNMHIDTKTLPALTDNTVWTKVSGSREDPTVKDKGSENYTSEYGTVTLPIPELSDETVWTKGDRTDPTLDGAGSEEYTSMDYGEVTITIPALTDPIWIKDDSKHVDPTEADTGKDVYTSVYGEVEVILPVKEHTHVWGDWSIIANPTLTTTGTAERACTKNSEHTETKTLPALTDTTVWTKVDDEHVDPTENSDGRDVYTSEYGEVTVTLDKLPHTHDLTHIPEVPATETTEGVKEHWHCDGCGKDFADEDGTKELTGDAIKIGKLEVEIQAPTNVPKPEIATPQEELIAAALTENEQKKVDEGTDIKIILKVEDASDTVSAEDKGNVETAIGNLTNYKLGQYLDVILLKKIGEEQEQKITKTNAPIKVTFEIPAALRGKAEYSVIRVHGGETGVLSDMDSDPNTVTIETDKFSTYTLVYKDVKAEPEQPGDSSSSDDNDDDKDEGGQPTQAVVQPAQPQPSVQPQQPAQTDKAAEVKSAGTGDRTPIALYGGLALLSMMAAGAALLERKKRFPQ